MKNWGYAKGWPDETREDITNQVNALIEAGAEEVVLEYKFTSSKAIPSITSDCCRLDDYVSLHYLLKHMAHLVQAVVWTAGLDDRLADSGLIPF